MTTAALLHHLPFPPYHSTSLHHPKPPTHRRSLRLYPLLPHGRHRIVPCASRIVGPPIEELTKSSEDLSILLDVTEMMCCACFSRVKAILSSDEGVESAAVNMLTETAAVRLREKTVVDEVAVSLARRLTECGFEARRLMVEGSGVEEKVRKWKKMMGKKEKLVEESGKRVVFAWTLVALCCGSHAYHVLHSLGIHVHGGLWDLLDNSYVKGGLALGSLLGPGRGA